MLRTKTSPRFRITGFLQGIFGPSSLVVLGFVLASVILTFPLVVHLGNAVRDPGDPLLDTWILAWDVHALTTNPLGLYQANIFFPFLDLLTYSEVLLGEAIFAAPVILLTGNPILAHNLLVLASFAVSGLGAYCLAYHLTGHRTGGILAGVIFGFCTYHFDHLSHLNLLMIQWLPLALLFLHRGFENGRRRDFVVFALFFVLQAWSSFYYAFFAALAVGVFLTYEFLTSNRGRRPEMLRNFGLAVLISGVLIVPFGIPYFESQQTFGFQRNLAEVQDLSASFQDYFAAPPESVLYGSLTRPFTSQTKWPLEHFLFPGLVGPVIALAGLLSLRRRSKAANQSRMGVVDATRLSGRLAPRVRLVDLEIAGTREQYRYVVLALFGFVLSLGPFLQVFGHLTHVPLPYLLFYRFFPGFTAMRAPVRFDIIVMLGVAILAGFGLARLDDYLQSFALPRPCRLGALALLPLLAAGEFAVGPVALTPVATGEMVPPVYRWLATTDPTAPVAEMPASPEGSFFAEYYSAYHWHPLVNGQSGFTPPGYPDLAAQVNAFPAKGAVDDLRAVGVRYLVVHRKQVGADLANGIRARATQDGVHLINAFGDDDLYQLQPLTPQSVSAATLKIEIPSSVAPDAPAAAVVLIENQSDQPVVFPVGSRVRAVVTWDKDAPRRVDAGDLPLFLNAGGGDTAAIPLGNLPAIGKHSLSITLSGPIEKEVSGAVDVVPHLDSSLSHDALHATFSNWQVPVQVIAGQTFTIGVVADNVGSAVWLQQAPDYQGQVGLGLQGWFTEDGKPVLGNHGEILGGRGWLAADVLPGQETAAALTTTAPKVPGSYVVKVAMVSEHVAWFSDDSSPDGYEFHIQVTK